MDIIQAARRPFIVPLLATLGIAIPAMGAMLQPSNHPDVYVRAAEDTVNIETALNQAAAAGPGAVVELAEGTFYVSRPIAVRDFDGTFKGQGAGATTVRTIGDNAFPLAAAPLPPLPMMIAFHYRDGAGDPSAPATLAVSQMTLHFAGFATPWTLNSPFTRFRNGLALMVLGRMSSTPVEGDPSRVGPAAMPAYLDVMVADVAMKSDVRDMGFSGACMWGWAPWTIQSSAFGDFFSTGATGTVHGSVTVARSSFTNIRTGVNVVSHVGSSIVLEDVVDRAGRTVVQVDWLIDSAVRVSRLDAGDVRIGLIAYSPTGGSVDFSDSSLAFGTYPSHVAVRMVEPRDARVTLAGLDLVNGSALEFEETFSATPSTYRVFGNTILRAPDTSWGGVEAHGVATAAAGDFSPRLFVEHNQIRSQGHQGVFAPIFSDGIDHVTASNNVFTGTAGPLAIVPAAVIVRNGDGCRLINNDVSGFSTPGPQYYLENVDDCLIAAGASAGGTSEEQVIINGGTDNRVVGARAAGFTGPAIDWVAASNAKRAMLQSMNDD